MNIDPKDRQKVMLMGGMMLLIACILIYQFTTLSSQPGASVPPTAPTDSKTTPQTVAAVAGFESIDPPSGPGVPDPDPFRPVLKETGVKPTQEEGTTTTTLNENAGITGVKPPLPDVQVHEIPVPKLTGVLLGSKPLAVFLIDGKSTMASEGQQLPGGYVVRTIKDDAVELTHGKKSTWVKLED